jgi:hypothetical protein
LTRAAISEHTIANGFAENIYYYADDIGNLYIARDANFGDSVPDEVLTLNLPTVANAFGQLNSASQIIITGLAVNPVADLTSFANVNGAFAPFAGAVGEILYVSFWDPEGDRG